jgi:hypothetical protein
MKESQGLYTEEKQQDALKNVYVGIIEGRKGELKLMLTNLEEQAKSLETTNA